MVDLVEEESLEKLLIDLLTLEEVEEERKVAVAKKVVKKPVLLSLELKLKNLILNLIQKKNRKNIIHISK
jgi:hypothetical protein